jgi:exonuclease V gamma subunit
MPLSVSYYPSATEAFADALSHLDRATSACDLFGEVHVLVPTVGMKSWLTEQLAQLLGASGNADGVVANVRFHMPNVLTKGSFGKREDDSWAQERVTGLLFEHFASQRPARSTTERDGAAAFIASSGGPLAAAVRLAGMFNKYSSRRLAMLQLWARGQASLMPVASEVGGEGSAPELAATDL